METDREQTSGTEENQKSDILEVKKIVEKEHYDVLKLGP